VYFLTLKRPVSATSTDFALTQPIYPPKELLVAGCGLLEMPICLRSAKRVATVESRKLPATNNQKPQLFCYGPSVQNPAWGLGYDIWVTSQKNEKQSLVIVAPMVYDFRGQKTYNRAHGGLKKFSRGFFQA
jgi:hypothetical protein